MIAASTLVLLVLLYLAYRYTGLSMGSLIVGVAIGAAYSGATLVSTLGDLTTDGTTSISSSVQNVFDQVVK